MSLTNLFRFASQVINHRLSHQRHNITNHVRHQVVHNFGHQLRHLFDACNRAWQSARQPCSSITGMTFGIIIGNSMGNKTGNMGFIKLSAPGILPIARIIGPIPKGMASINCGHIVPIRLAKPCGVISDMKASKTPHWLCTSGLGSGKS